MNIDVLQKGFQSKLFIGVKTGVPTSHRLDPVISLHQVTLALPTAEVRLLARVVRAGRGLAQGTPRSGAELFTADWLRRCQVMRQCQVGPHMSTCRCVTTAKRLESTLCRSAEHVELLLCHQPKVAKCCCVIQPVHLNCHCVCWPGLLPLCLSAGSLAMLLLCQSLRRAYGPVHRVVCLILRGWCSVVSTERNSHVSCSICPATKVYHRRAPCVEP